MAADTVEWLPIGSVIVLRGAKAPCMIIGRMISSGNNEKVWDYAGCIYPFGIGASDGCVVFEAGKIESVLHVGLKCEEEEELAMMLSEKRNQILN